MCATHVAATSTQHTTFDYAPLSSYALPTRCPVLRQRMALPGAMYAFPKISLPAKAIAAAAGQTASDYADATSIYAGNAAVYADTAPIYAGTTSIYAGTAAVSACTAPAHAGMSQRPRC
eukprot:1133044-Rhodomonas_salina.1